MKPYNALLESLAASKVNDESHKSKRRKVVDDELVTEEVGSDIDEADEEDVEGIVEDEEEAVEEEEDDDESPLDPFEAHFANPSAEYLKRIEAAKKGEWESTKLSKPVIGRGVQSIPAGSDAVPARRFDTIKSLQLKKRRSPPSKRSTES